MCVLPLPLTPLSTHTQTHRCTLCLYLPTARTQCNNTGSSKGARHKYLLKHDTLRAACFLQLEHRGVNHSLQVLGHCMVECTCTLNCMVWIDEQQHWTDIRLKVKAANASTSVMCQIPTFALIQSHSQMYRQCDCLELQRAHAQPEAKFNLVKQRILGKTPQNRGL